MAEIIAGVVVSGDLEAVISLVENRKASVFDMSESGWSLLHVSMVLSLINSLD